MQEDNPFAQRLITQMNQMTMTNKWYVHLNAVSVLSLMENLIHSLIAVKVTFFVI